ncbi:MAG TPA: hypothetical protein P5026_01525 [Kiritimatiellia bacterium]|nr:hypothetical protein [Kiritimatiellia bacterium]HRU69801.1 hypothetical protein [Kiritimatiellia bacterium]
MADIRPKADRTIQVSFRKGTGNVGNNNYLTAWELSYPESSLPVPDFAPIAGKRILILGNNLFSQDNIPNMLANLAAAAGHSRPFVIADTASGRTLAQNTARVESASLSYANVQHPLLTGTNTWDEVVLQGDFVDPTHLGDPTAYSANLIALWNNAYGNINPMNGQTYSNAFCVARFSGLWPNAAYTFTIYGARSNISNSRETKYNIEGTTSGEALLECNNNTSNVVVIPKIRPRPDGTLDLRITAGPNNTSPEKFYHINAMMIEAAFGSTLISIQ